MSEMGWVTCKLMLTGGGEKGKDGLWIPIRLHHKNNLNTHGDP